MSYPTPPGGLPPQTALFANRAVFTEAYAVIPHGVMRDIVTSHLPHWSGTRAWILARPMSGFSETFSHYVMELAPEGGSSMPEPDSRAEAVLFVADGALELTLETTHQLKAGSYVYLPPDTDWSLINRGKDPATFHWIRKIYQIADGIETPRAFVTHRDKATRIDMAHTDGRWATERFVDPDDLTHDMHVNVVTFEPGGTIPFLETHVMEHGIYILEGKAGYRLNQDWVEVEAGDFLWLRAFCPQACYAGGPGRFSYLLYKDVNRHAILRP